MITTPPPCFGYYGKQTNCASCLWSEACRKVIARNRLKPIVEAILQAEKILRGESLG
jgi:hypothetical protein